MKQRFLTVASAVIAAAAAIIWAVQGATPTDPASAAPGAWATPNVTPSSQSTPTMERVEASDEEGARLYTYAVPIVELQGLSPDVAPGSRLDLWVTWQPPVVDKPDVRRLLEGVILERIVPPTLPDGPHAAVLQVPTRRAHRLIWGHRFGVLSVLEPSSTGT